MDVNSEYGPRNLTYYTSWWLASKSSISSQSATSGSAEDSLKLDDECLIIQQVINHIIKYVFFLNIYYSSLLIKIKYNQIVVYHLKEFDENDSYL